MSQEVNLLRRRLFGAVAMTIAAVKLDKTGRTAPDQVGNEHLAPVTEAKSGRIPRMLPRITVPVQQLDASETSIPDHRRFREMR